LSYIESTARHIAAALRPGQLIVLESTTYPGTTRDVLLPILAAGGLKPGTDFFLAYSPEREDPGNPNFSAAAIPKVVGGIEAGSAELAEALYSQAVVKVVPVSSCEVAEACKILENTYRSVNIAMVNELKMLFDRIGLDVWEVIEMLEDLGSPARLQRESHLDERQIQLAVAYHRECAIEIDDAIAENRRPPSEWASLFPFVRTESSG
jgi:nucleotide sugar dehydrogenase